MANNSKIFALFGLCLVFAAAYATTEPLSKTVRIISTKESPCSCLELGEKTHEIAATRPILLQLNLLTNASAEYDNIFGPGAHKAPSHKEHFECVKAFMIGLQSVTTSLFDRLEDAIEMRAGTEAFRGGRPPRSPAVPIALALASLVTTGGLLIFN